MIDPNIVFALLMGVFAYFTHVRIKRLETDLQEAYEMLDMMSSGWDKLLNNFEESVSKTNANFFQMGEAMNHLAKTVQENHHADYKESGFQNLH